jgi:hypothetical protein
MTAFAHFATRCIVLGACAASPIFAQTQTPPPASKPAVPAWAQPGSATHTQVAPPTEFHQPTQTFNVPIGIFDGQSDVGGPALPGSASFDASTGKYTVNSAGYNIWYTRDEFRFLWKKLSGDASLAADVSFPNTAGYGDRKAVLIIRQDLDDNSSEVLVGLHGTGMLQFAQRPEKAARIKDMEYTFAGRGIPGGASLDSLVTIYPKRLGIEKHGRAISLFVSLQGEPMHQYGPPIELPIDGPFYIGVGFCSHMPDKVDTVVLSNVTIENSAGKVR